METASKRSVTAPAATAQPGPRGRGGAKRAKARAKPAATASPAVDRRALIVAINDYRGTVNDLPSCLNDAHAIDELARGSYKFSSSTLLLDGNATQANVAAELQRLFHKATPDTRLLFYYSGHGTTERVGDKLEECLVLHDGFFFDDKLVQLSQAAPAGILTALIDSCFSGGMDKQLLTTIFSPGRPVERTKIKAYLRVDPVDFESHNVDEQVLGSGKRFLGSAFPTPIKLATAITRGDQPLKALIPAPASDEEGQQPLNGLLLSACLETETAAASTPATDGKSSFTYALTRAVKTLGQEASNTRLVEAVQQHLKQLGFRQTPLIKEPLRPAGLGSRSFLTLGEPKSGVAQAGEIQQSASAAIVEALAQIIAGGGTTMDAGTIIQIINALSKSSQPAPSSKGLVDLLPVILPLIVKSAAPQPAGKGLIDILPTILPLILKQNDGPQQKLFGIDDAILIPALTTIITSAINKSAPQQKLFGIDDAILIPAITSIAVAALNK